MEELTINKKIKMRLMNSTLIITYFLLSSCTSIKPGVYTSVCEIYHKSALVLELNSDKTFEYKKPYIDEKVTGTWEQKKNVLILSSKYFELQSKKEIDSIYKFTEAKDNDIYQIKGNKLLIYGENKKFVKKCLLKKSK